MRTSVISYIEMIRFLADSSVSKISDEQWVNILNWSLAILSRDAGPKRSVSLTGTGPDYDLPDDFIFVRYLIAKNGETLRTLKQIELRPTDTLSYAESAGYPKSYIVKFRDNDTLTLTTNADSSESYTLYYIGQYDDVTLNGDLPFDNGWRENALSHLMLATSLSPIEVKRSKLEQYASAPELKVGNPPSELAERHYARYRRMIADKA